MPPSRRIKRCFCLTSDVCLSESDSCSGQRGNVLSVGNYCYTLRCTRRPQWEEKGRGISWRSPAYTLLLLLLLSSSSSVFVFLRGARFSINSAFLLSKFCSEYYSESIGLGQNCTYYITVVRYCFRHCSAVCFCRLLVTTRGSKTRLSTTKSIVITVTDIAAGSAAVAAAAAAAATALYRCTGLCFC